MKPHFKKKKQDHAGNTLALEEGASNVVWQITGFLLLQFKKKKEPTEKMILLIHLSRKMGIL